MTDSLTFTLAWRGGAERQYPYVQITGPFGEYALDSPTFGSLRAAQRWASREARKWRKRGWDVTWVDARLADD